MKYCRISAVVSASIVLVAASFGQSHALRFTKAGQAVVVPDCDALHLTGDMTIEAWVRPEQDVRDFSFKFILSKNYAGKGFALLLVGHGDKNRVQFEANQVISVRIAEPAMRNHWWHLAGVVKGEDETLYVNGVAVATAKERARSFTSLPLWIGASLWTGFRGSIAEVRIWNVARTPEQITGAKDSYLQGDEDGLVAYFPFLEGTGRVLHDLTGNCKPGVIGYGFKGTPRSNRNFFESGKCLNEDLPQWAEGPRLSGKEPRLHRN